MLDVIIQHSPKKENLSEKFFYNSSASENKKGKIVLAQILTFLFSLRERPLMSKGSCAAAKSAAGAALRMA